MKLALSLSLVLVAAASLNADDATLKPLMLVPGEVLFTDDFSDARGDLVAKRAEEGDSWVPNQGTRWTIADGVLRGRASSPEFQAARPHHKGLHPRIVLAKTPAAYVLQASLRIVDGKPFDPTRPRSISPFLEIGHHIARITWGTNGAMLLADHDTLQIADAPDFQLEPGRWYRFLIERRDDEVLVQFADGPRFYGRHPTYVSELHFVMFGGLEAGTMELDDVTVWAVKAGTQSDWDRTRSTFPPAQSVRIREPKPTASAATK